MELMQLHSFVNGHWIAPSGDMRLIHSAVTGDEIAQAGSGAVDFQEVLDHARRHGGPVLRKMTFHDRARLLKAMALHLNEHREQLYSLSYMTGATLADSKIDIDGGIATLLVFASKGRRELPDEKIYTEGALESLSRKGSFLGQHVCTPLQGAAVHINAFNFPVWGMLEKLAPTFLAGVPAIIKPATDTSFVTEACVRIMANSGIFPQGSFQLIMGGTGDLLDRLGCQDVVSFTGSANTAFKLRSNANILRNSIRFMAEQDSLNASILGPDVTPQTPEFELFIKEAIKEITAKAGQKCTAIRRIIAPENLVDPVISAMTEQLDKIMIGNPSEKDTDMGALASAAQVADVLQKAAIIETEACRVYGDPVMNKVNGEGMQNGAFVAPMLFHCANPDNATRVHDTEAFGPVATIMPYRDLDHASELLNRGGGSLVASVITRSPDVAREMVESSAAFHGRLYFNNRDSMGESTGHGSPLPHMIHGGPGRAGGSEEMGGIRGVMHYMQRTAIQGSPDILTGITGTWVQGAARTHPAIHPFKRYFEQLSIGEAISAGPRIISLDDIEHFAHFTGDTFYAHMDDKAAAANPFFPGRVAHGYLLLSFAAGLFVEPAPGPVLANTGLEALSFQKPVSAGDALSVTLTVQKKTRRTDTYGEVRWDVVLENQDNEKVAHYTLLTMNQYDVVTAA